VQPPSVHFRTASPPAHYATRAHHTRRPVEGAFWAAGLWLAAPAAPVGGGRRPGSPLAGPLLTYATGSDEQMFGAK